jgi:hypothetical protein
MMSASADATSVMHQITAYAGEKGVAPLQQAFPQPPASTQVGVIWTTKNSTTRFSERVMPHH